MGTETVAIIVPAAVAITAIGATTWQQLRTLAHARELTDLENIRGVLDEAAIALHTTAYELDDLRSRMTQHRGVDFFKSVEGTNLYARLGEEGRHFDVLYERLSVRLGRAGQVVLAFKDAADAFLDTWRAVGSLRLEPEPDGNASAKAEITAFDAENKRRITMNRVRFDDARERFVSAANAVAGSRLRERS